MRRLILLRHGKAEIAALTGGDSERPLAERGRVEAGLTAAWLAGAGFAPDLALVSTAVRTRATWDAARTAFPGAPHNVDPALYLGGAEMILDVVDAASVRTASPQAATIMVVGHNPGLQELALQLAIDSGAPQVQIARIADGFPPATACVFRMNGTVGVGLEAIYEPPGRPGGSPRWTFVCPATGAAV
jgi:phosphohistidine phosphatase